MDCPLAYSVHVSTSLSTQCTTQIDSSQVLLNCNTAQPGGVKAPEYACVLVTMPHKP